MIVIVGAGEIGVYVAKRLTGAGFDVVLVEINKEIAQEVASLHHIQVVNDDATNPEVLKKVGVDKANVVMALTPSDEKNLMVCEFSKMLGAKRVAAKVNKSRNQKMFQALGIDVAISPPLILAYYFEAVAFDYSLMGTREFDTIFMKVVEGSAASGKKVSNFRGKDCFISAILRGPRVIDPQEDETIHAGDTLVLVGNRDGCRKASLKIQGG
ncbi:MAG: hypothetical protein GXO65_01955 [Euryarchaeota archaeon]|nr:hypothetical protein [Euryarchaeota archaeon]